MSIIQGMFLGIVQGLTEFLPVSSSGHLVFFKKLFGLEGNLLFDIVLHLATVLAVIIVFRKTIWDIIKHPFGQKGRMIIYSCIPTLVLALLFKDLLEDPSGVFLGCAFLMSAIILTLAQVLAQQQLSKKVYQPLQTKHSIIMGIAQGLACFPGISRSGSTISAGLISGANKNDVAEFSFLMSAPVIFGAFILEIIGVSQNEVSISFPVWPTIVGFICAFVAGLFAIKIMIKAIKKLNLMWFSAYLVVIGVVTLIFIK